MRYHNVDEKIPQTSESLLSYHTKIRFEIETPHTSADFLFRCLYIKCTNKVFLYKTRRQKNLIKVAKQHKNIPFLSSDSSMLIRRHVF